MSARSASRARGWSRSRRRRPSPARKLLGGVVLLALLVGVGWWALSGSGADDAVAPPTLAQGADAAMPETALPDPTPSTRRAIDTVRPEPVGSPASTPMVAASNESRERPEPLSVIRMGESVTSVGSPERSEPIVTAPAARTETPQTAPPTRSEPARGARDGHPPMSLSSPEAVQDLIRRGVRAMSENRLLEARDLLNRALQDSRSTERDRELLRERLTTLNETLIFSPAVIEGDPLTTRYTVRSGDSLVRIASREGLHVDWRFIQRVNGINDPTRIRVGQTLKLVKGPFHAVISKSQYRMDLYVENRQGSGSLMYVRSYAVGLGEYGSTPIGSWIVRPNSKLINPRWVNPRTGEVFEADDPKNPIGERWVGLDGTDPQTQTLSGYGIHGTIEPDSIGRDMSMGCVRLLPGEIDVVYELLTEGVSTVAIVP